MILAELYKGLKQRVIRFCFSSKNGGRGFGLGGLFERRKENKTFVFFPMYDSLIIIIFLFIIKNSSSSSSPQKKQKAMFRAARTATTSRILKQLEVEKTIPNLGEQYKVLEPLLQAELNAWEKGFLAMNYKLKLILEKWLQVYGARFDRGTPVMTRYCRTQNLRMGEMWQLYLNDMYKEWDDFNRSVKARVMLGREESEIFYL